MSETSIQIKRPDGLNDSWLSNQLRDSPCLISVKWLIKALRVVLSFFLASSVTHTSHLSTRSPSDGHFLPSSHCSTLIGVAFLSTNPAFSYRSERDLLKTPDIEDENDSPMMILTRFATDSLCLIYAFFRSMISFPCVSGLQLTMSGLKFCPFSPIFINCPSMASIIRRAEVPMSSLGNICIKSQPASTAL